MKSALRSTSRKPPLLQRQARQVSRLHRWLGTGFCLLFTLWFGTGFIMMYVPFPSLGEGERVAASEPVRLAGLKLAPAAAARGLPVQRLRLVDVLGRARYLATLEDGSVRSIDAADGSTPPPLDSAAARQVAESFAGRGAREVSGPFDHDQWVVHQRFDAARPFYRVDIDDAADTELYVSVRLGQVLQRTTRFERGWNWVGAVVHWVYPTVLRKSLWAWDQVVWWLALGGLIVAGAGYGLGLVRMINVRRSGRSGVSPFRGWLHWHHVLGLTGGLVALTWVFSGWLSMDHGRLFSSDQAGAERGARLRGASMASAMAGLTPDTLRTLGTAREIEFLAVGGRAFVVRRAAADSPYRLVPLEAGVPQPPAAALPDALLARAVATAWAPAYTLSGPSPATTPTAIHVRNRCRIPRGAPILTTRPAPGCTWTRNRARSFPRWMPAGAFTAGCTPACTLSTSPC